MSHVIGSRVISILITLSLLCLWSCSNTDSCRVLPNERAQLIEQLQEARQTDLKDARDTALGPDAAGDYMTQAGKAETAIDDLSQHSNVPKSEISDALFVPPKHLSPARRAELIKQLEQAKSRDDEIFHTHLGGWDPILTEDCNIQGERVERVVNKLETERPVSWSEINQAMWVPDEYAWWFRQAGRRRVPSGLTTANTAMPNDRNYRTRSGKSTR
jgi:hypothetical protein